MADPASAASHSRPGTSSSFGTGSGGAGSDQGAASIGECYELENSVSEIFRICNVEESSSFSPESVAEHLTKKLGRQSKKPFSVFYNRLSANPEFVQRYENIKYQNINEVDPFVRLLVRFRENKELNEKLNSLPETTAVAAAAAAAAPPSEIGPFPIASRFRNLNSNYSEHPNSISPSSASSAAGAAAYRKRSKPRTHAVHHSNDSPGSLAAYTPSSSPAIATSSATTSATTATSSHHPRRRSKSPGHHLIREREHHQKERNLHHHQYPESLPQSSSLSANAQNSDYQRNSNTQQQPQQYQRYPSTMANQHQPQPQPQSESAPFYLRSDPQAANNIYNNNNGNNFAGRSRSPHYSASSPQYSSTATATAAAYNNADFDNESSFDCSMPETVMMAPGIAGSSITTSHQNRNRNSAAISTPASQPQSTTTSKKLVPAYLSRDFHPCDWPLEDDCFGSLGSIANVNAQEQFLLRDLLYVLIGIEGRYIRLRRSDDSARYKLVLDPSADRHLVVTTNQILKISYCYSAIVTYVESKVYGLVNQSLVAAIHRHLHEYNMLVASMEEQLMRNELFLQKMFYQLLPYISTFNLLRDLATKLYRNKCVGGGVLTVLHEKTKSIQGMDNKALELCLTLTKSASMPYFDILKTWIYYGEIRDPRREFFIEDTHHTTSHQASTATATITAGSSSTNADNGSYMSTHAKYDCKNNGHRNGGSSKRSMAPMTIESDDDEYDDDFGKFNDKYWDLRYRINSSKTPIFLKKYEQMIYKTGKYVSIINKVKALFMKSSRVPLPPPQSSSLSSLGAFSSLPHNNHPNGSHHQFGGAGSSSDFGTSVSKYSLNDLLRGVASMQMIGGGPASGVPPFSSIPPDLSQAGGINSLMSSSSTSSSNSALSGGSAGNAPTATTRQANTASAAAVAAAIFTPKPEEISYSFDDSTYIAPIIAAYEEASSQLLHILVNESQLVETFNAVKHYMLLSMGDFIVHFMKFAAKDLGKRTDSVVQHRLDSMMGMALGISVAAGDRALLKDDPHVEFTGKSFLKQIIKIMKPLATTAAESNMSTGVAAANRTANSSYLLHRSSMNLGIGGVVDKFDYEANDDGDDDDDDDDESSNDFGLNRSIISDMIEGKDDSRFILTTSSNVGNAKTGFSQSVSGTTAAAAAGNSGNFLPGMSITSQVRLRKQFMYLNSGKSPAKQQQDYLDSAAAAKLSAQVNSANNNNNGVQSNLQLIGGATGLPPSSAAAAVASNGNQQNNNKQTKLYCYESLMLKFDVPFPLSLIFTQKSIVCYQLLFRYVFLCRYAEMELEETWKDNILNVQLRQADSLARKAVSSSMTAIVVGAGLVPEDSTVSPDTTVRQLVKAFKSMHKKAFALRYKMIAFVRNFHYFYAFEVIDPFFAQFISQITRRGSSLDSVIEYHEKFLEHCFSSCFLTSLEITSIIIKIFMLCIELSHALKDSIDPDDHSSMMESSCFFSRAAGDPNPYSTGLKSRDSSDGPSGAGAGSGAGGGGGGGSTGSGTFGGSRLSPSGVFESQLHEKLNKIYFANRHFGKSVRTVKEIVERANSEFDALVTKLLKKIYSDNCEYHMMYPFVARLDFNDFYRSKIID